MWRFEHVLINIKSKKTVNNYLDLASAGNWRTTHLRDSAAHRSSSEPICALSSLTFCRRLETKKIGKKFGCVSLIVSYLYAVYCNNDG